MTKDISLDNKFVELNFDESMDIDGGCCLLGGLVAKVVACVVAICAPKICVPVICVPVVCVPKTCTPSKPVL